MRRIFPILMAAVTIAGVVLSVSAAAVFAATSEPVDQKIDPAPCVAAVTANDDDRIVAVCGPLIDSEKTAKADRVKALVARAAAFERKDMTDRAIGDYNAALQVDPTLADVFNARGVLWRKQGNRPRALADFGAAIKLNPDHPAARANYKSLAQEVERIGAMLAVNNRPSFDCATARRAVEKAICANPELANLDREINAVNTRVVQKAGKAGPRAGRAMQQEQDDFIARRNAAFGRPDYDLPKQMRQRLDHLLAVERQ